VTSHYVTPSCSDVIGLNVRIRKYVCEGINKYDITLTPAADGNPLSPMLDALFHDDSLD